MKREFHENFLRIVRSDIKSYKETIDNNESTYSEKDIAQALLNYAEWCARVIEKYLEVGE